MAPVDLYYYNPSAPCRAVVMTAKVLGVELNLKTLDLMKGEQMSPEFLKINPQHNVPTINDAGFILTESRAIIQYLANKYAKDESLYPKVPKERALVDQRLYFDSGTYYAAFGDYVVSINANLVMINNELGLTNIQFMFAVPSDVSWSKRIERRQEKSFRNCDWIFRTVLVPAQICSW